jgi:hypothetical protein
MEGHWAWRPAAGEPIETTDSYDQARERRRYWAHQLVKMKLAKEHGVHVGNTRLAGRRLHVTFPVYIGDPGRFVCPKCGMTSDYPEEIRGSGCQECGGWEPPYAG